LGSVGGSGVGLRLDRVLDELIQRIRQFAVFIGAGWPNFAQLRKRREQLPRALKLNGPGINDYVAPHMLTPQD
jgi:hypothetical protein